MIAAAKRPKKEPTHLSEYDVTVLTAAEQTEHFNSDVESYWKLMHLLQFHYVNSLHLIDHYKVLYIYIIFLDL